MHHNWEKKVECCFGVAKTIVIPFSTWRGSNFTVLKNYLRLSFWEKKIRSLGPANKKF
jgi:hypothetical protein